MSFLYIVDTSGVNHGSNLDSVLCCLGLQVIATHPSDVLSGVSMSFKALYERCSHC